MARRTSSPSLQIGPIWEIGVRATTTSVDAASGAQALVVGCGIAGLTCALLLLREGMTVALLDRAGIGGLPEDGGDAEGQTLRTSAHLANALDDRFYRLERWHGRAGSRLAAQSHGAAIDWIESLAADSDEDCGYRRVDGYLFSHDGDIRELEREFEAARRAGLDPRWLATGIPELSQLGSAIRFPNQARIDMGRYLGLLVRRVAALGGRFVRAEAVEVDPELPLVTLADGRELRCQHLVLACNSPFHLRVRLQTRQASYRTFVIALEARAARVPDALLWDTGDPYHYVRQVPAERDRPALLLVGGEDHKVGQYEAGHAPYRKLETWTRERIPGCGQVLRAWSGQIVEPVDGLASIGRSPGTERVYLATGDSGNGLTHGTIAGLLIRDLVLGRRNPWTQLYDPSRKPVRSSGNWAYENGNVVPQYLDWLRPGERAPAPGEGRVVRRGVDRVALYTGPDGRTHAFHALCPHLGCSVRWNPDERSWDCPCHGSRFDAEDGHVLNGPAAYGLAAAPRGTD